MCTFCSPNIEAVQGRDGSSGGKGPQLLLSFCATILKVPFLSTGSQVDRHRNVHPHSNQREGERIRAARTPAWKDPGWRLRSPLLRPSLHSDWILQLSCAAREHGNVIWEVMHQIKTIKITIEKGKRIFGDSYQFLPQWTRILKSL